MKMTNTAKIKIGAIVAGIIALVAIACWFTKSVSETTMSVDADQTIDVTPEQIERIKAIGEWEFLSVAFEEMVDTTRRGFFSDDHLTRIYYGTLRLGVDMQQVESGWIQVQGDSIEVTLPAIRLLDKNFIDEARTKSFYESGRWKPADREALYQRARQRMLKRGLTKQYVETAKTNGEAQFRQMMLSMGYEHVSIQFKGKCKSEK
ncbi:MAG: DUF4230 domain-containing protein [Prevotella sp.]|nr:DUF4230 domain-containing protein [Prevotella sp.]